MPPVGVRRHKRKNGFFVYEEEEEENVVSSDDFDPDDSMKKKKKVVFSGNINSSSNFVKCSDLGLWNLSRLFGTLINTTQILIDVFDANRTLIPGMCRGCFKRGCV